MCTVSRSGVWSKVATALQWQSGNEVLCKSRPLQAKMIACLKLLRKLQGRETRVSTPALCCKMDDPAASPSLNVVGPLLSGVCILLELPRVLGEHGPS